MEKKLSPGLIQVYTGDGKGKTTCALGLGFRAVGRGLKVFMIQFIKGEDTGELYTAARLLPDFTIRQSGLGGFIRKGSLDPEDVARARQALDLAREIIMAGEYDLVILDEINVAMYFGFFAPDEVLGIIQARPSHVEVVLTGRYAPEEIVAAADLVTEMKAIKHYYTAGVKARRGIEH